ncbi:hypothetical protein IWW47_006276, partial [Coemansia sp. RSA 2052]
PCGRQLVQARAIPLAGSIRGAHGGRGADADNKGAQAHSVAVLERDVRSDGQADQRHHGASFRPAQVQEARAGLPGRHKCTGQSAHQRRGWWRGYGDSGPQELQQQRPSARPAGSA